MTTTNRWVRDAAALRPAAAQTPGLPMPPMPQLEVRYLTDPEIYRAVLPPPLEPAAEPRVHVRVTDIDISIGDYSHKEKIGYFALDALYRGEKGEYPLVMPLDLEAAIYPSRERFGEPKRLAAVEIGRQGDHVEARVTRNGVTIWEITGDVTEALPTPEPELHREWWFKFLPSVEGDGFDYGPMLVRAETQMTTQSLERIEGKLVLRDSPTDPVADIPVREVESIRWRVFGGQHVVKLEGPVDAQAFLPYAHARYDSF